ncbi:MAG: hypothetical protein KGI60_01430 [Patescibacteria group bacterium]|nr:hypothetical protein [Patescibacteria group bacterium]
MARDYLTEKLCEMTTEMESWPEWMIRESGLRATFEWGKKFRDEQLRKQQRKEERNRRRAARRRELKKK